MTTSEVLKCIERAHDIINHIMLGITIRHELDPNIPACAEGLADAIALLVPAQTELRRSTKSQTMKKRHI